MAFLVLGAGAQGGYGEVGGSFWVCMALYMLAGTVCAFGASDVDLCTSRAVSAFWMSFAMSVRPSIFRSFVLELKSGYRFSPSHSCLVCLTMTMPSQATLEL